MKTTNQIAGELYEAYCVAVGGKAFNGDPLPNWEAFLADPAKKKQSDAWIAVTMATNTACKFMRKGTRVSWLAEGATIRGHGVTITDDQHMLLRPASLGQGAVKKL